MAGKGSAIGVCLGGAAIGSIAGPEGAVIGCFAALLSGCGSDDATTSDISDGDGQTQPTITVVTADGEKLLSPRDRRREVSITQYCNSEGRFADDVRFTATTSADATVRAFSDATAFSLNRRNCITASSRGTNYCEIMQPVFDTRTGLFDWKNASQEATIVLRAETPDPVYSALYYITVEAICSNPAQ